MPAPADGDTRRLIAGNTELRQARRAMDELSSGQLDHWVATQSSGVGIALPGELSALLTAGFVLFLITLLVNTIAAIIVNRGRSGASTEI